MFELRPYLESTLKADALDDAKQLTGVVEDRLRIAFSRFWVEPGGDFLWLCSHIIVSWQDGLSIVESEVAHV